MGYYIYSDPKKSLQFKVMLSKFGLSQTGRDEQQRMDSIDALDIPFEQRESLKNRNVFIGATKTMVKLAFGPSKFPPRYTEKNEEVWVYYFDDYDRPLFLFFEADILVAAKKGSNADLAVIK
jgi:hypothetical protein